jgi:hypothetical protein
MKSGKSKWNRLLRGLRLDLQSPMASDSMVDWWLRVRLEHNTSTSEKALTLSSSSPHGVFGANTTKECFMAC